MRIIDVKCPKCEKVTEIEYHAGMKVPKCPKCGTEMVRVYTAPNLHNLPTVGSKLSGGK